MASTLLDDLVAWWDLDDRSDALGVNDLVDQTSAPEFVAGLVGNCYANDEGAGAVGLSSSAAAFNPGNTSFTLSLWIRREDDVSSQFFAGQRSSSSQRCFQLEALAASVRARFSANGTSDAVQLDHSFELQLQEWHHVVLWHDAVNDQVGLVVDNGTPTTANHATGIHTSLTPIFTLGGISSSAGRLPGRIDSVGWWSRVLTAGERTELYNQGNGLSFADIAPQGGALFLLGH